MSGRFRVVACFILGLCFIIGGFFLNVWGSLQTGDAQRIFTNSGIFAVIIGLNVMIAFCVIAYYSRNPRV